MIFTDVNTKRVLKFAVMPGIVPQVRGFFSSGFSHLAYFIALVYRAVNLLPENHVYLRSSSIGHFGIAAVVSEAANHLVIRGKNIDQILIFLAILFGIVILFAQFAVLFLAMFAGTAMAMPTNYGEFFDVSGVDRDIAIALLGYVFGIDQLFPLPAQWPGIYGNGFYVGVHSMLQFYSFGLMIIAALILAYFIAAIVTETAQTGVPFGKRYNNVWAPIRLVVAMGLLIPITEGLNSAQWITLYAAKLGSNFATNGWSRFVDTLGDASPLGDDTTYIAESTVPRLEHIPYFMSIAKTCAVVNGRKFESSGGGGRVIDAYVIDNRTHTVAQPLSGVGYGKALQFADNGNIIIRFGERNETLYPEKKGYVQPWCGEMVFSVLDSTQYHAANVMRRHYYRMIRDIWTGNMLPELDNIANVFTRCHANIAGDTCPSGGAKFPSGYRTRAINIIRNSTISVMRRAIAAQRAIDVNGLGSTKAYGWAGAGIWYNRIAEMNGAVTASIRNVPRVTLWPYIMEKSKMEKLQENAGLVTANSVDSSGASGKKLQYKYPGDSDAANTLHQIRVYWETEHSPSSHTKLTHNAFVDAINAVFGTQGLFDMCKNIRVHPLAQLSTLGKGLIESSINNLGFSAGTGLAGMLDPHFGPALSAASGFLVAVAGIGMMIGFMLFYVLPFMPFLYFFFAVVGWIKGVFEAMVGVPLWALAHLRIDGQGLPGDAARDGYFLIFEIFVRPILIVFGFLAAIAILGAMVKILNNVFALVVSNIGGFNPGSGAATCGMNTSVTPATGSLDWLRGPIDQLFFTVVYAIIVYMMAMSSFKLIDLVPNNILRWMGAGVSTFGEQDISAANGMMMSIAGGGGMVGNSLKSAGSSAITAMREGKAAARQLSKMAEKAKGS